MNTRAIKTIEMPQEIFKSMLKTYQMWEEFSDEFEDFAFSSDKDFLTKMGKARKEHLKGKTHSLRDLKDEFNSPKILPF